MPHLIEHDQSHNDWYVVYAQPHKERWVESFLKHHLELETYLPMVRQRIRAGISIAPLFPRYLFVRADLSRGVLSAIQTTPGVTRLVAFDNTPMPVPAALIELIRQRVYELEARGGLLDYGFETNMPVRVKSGPFQGIEAIFVGPMTPSTRVRVLIEFLGELRETEINITSLEPCASQPHAAQRRERRTRGTGRPIKQKLYS